MKILSLFDGIACGYLSLLKANINITSYYASEIDKYAIKISNKHFPNIINLYDIKNWKNWNIDFKDIDLVIGGSPCQGFSIAGKLLNFNDERSSLFFYYLDILNHIKTLNPNVKFLLENVRMKYNIQNKISELLDVQPILINSSLVSAQNRERLYWFNWKSNLPINKNKIIKDILDENNEYELKNLNTFFNHNPYNIYSNRLIIDGIANINGFDIIKRCYNIYGKCPTLTTMQGGHRQPKIVINKQWRKLSPLECERLQTLPDNYTENLSNSQRYKCIGNGWTVDLIAHLFKNLKENN